MKQNKLKQWLGIVLVLQLVLVGVLYSLNKTPKSNETRNLLSGVASISRVVIADSQQQTTLQRQSDQWVLKERQNAPVDLSKWQPVLDKLGSQRLSWPVATSESSHDRFEVADDNFNKRVDIYINEQKTSSFYIGSSLGLKESYLRELDNNNTYTVDLNGADLFAKASEWLNKDVLKADNVTAIKTNGFKIENQNDTWRLEPSQNVSLPEDTILETEGDEQQSAADSSATPEQAVPSNETAVSQSKALEISNAFESLSVIDVAPELDWQSAASVFVRVKDTTEFQYLFLENEDAYYTKRGDQLLGFKISKDSYEVLANNSLDDILEAPQSDSATDSSIELQEQNEQVVK